MAAQRCWDCDEPIPPADPALPPRSGSIRFCSFTCRRRNHRRKCHKMARAKAAGSPVVERLDPIEVYTRDGWHCRICRCRTPRHLMGSGKDREPTLDHILPLKYRGHHTLANVRLTCRYCNEHRDIVLKRREARRDRRRSAHGK